MALRPSQTTGLAGRHQPASLTKANSLGEKGLKVTVRAKCNRLQQREQVPVDAGPVSPRLRAGDGARPGVSVPSWAHSWTAWSRRSWTY